MTTAALEASAPSPETTTPAPVTTDAPGTETIEKVEQTKPKTEDEALAAIYREAMSEEDGDKSKEQQQPKATVAAPEKGKQATEPVKTDAPARDASGKFAAKDKPAEPADDKDADAEPDAKADETDDEPKAKEAEEEEPEPTTEEEGSGLKVKDWSRKKREAFEKLPKEARDFVLNHHRELIGVHAKEKSEFQNYANRVDPFVKVLRANEDYLRRVSRELGAEPQAILGNLMATENVLRSGTYQQKLALFQRMASDYGIPIQVAASGGDEYEQQHSAADETIHDLKQKISQLEHQIETGSRSAKAEAEARNNASVQAFREATGADGALLHPHFDLVRPAMVELIDSKRAANLEDAYRIATEPMRKAIEDGLASALKKERRTDTQRAGRINVITAPAPVSSFASEDDMLANVYRKASGA